MKILGKKTIVPKSMELFKKTEQIDKKNSPLNVSFDINERTLLKTWAKNYKTTMSKIIKKALYEFYLRHEVEYAELKKNRISK